MGGTFFLAAYTQPKAFNKCLQLLELSYTSALPLDVAFRSEDTGSGIRGLTRDSKNYHSLPFFFTHDKVGGKYGGGLL